MSNLAIEGRFQTLYGDPSVVRTTTTDHPLGFQRIELMLPDKLLRKHDFPPGLMDGDRHQHGDNFTSEVDPCSNGRIIERLFKPQIDTEGGTHELWPVVCYADDNGEYHVDPQLDQVVRVNPLLVAEFEYKPGDTYRRPWTDYHQVTVLDGPVTTYSEWGPQATTRPHLFMRSREHPKSLYQQALSAGRPTTDIYVASHHTRP